MTTAPELLAIIMPEVKKIIENHFHYVPDNGDRFYINITVTITDVDNYELVEDKLEGYNKDVFSH